MPSSDPSFQQLGEAVAQLAAAVERSERRQARMERLYRWMALAVLTVAIAAVVISTQLIGQQPARASALGKLEAAVGSVEHEVAQKVAAAKSEAEKEFEKVMERLRSDVKEAKKLNPGHTIAVVLHDMEGAMEVMPVMAGDMNRMADDMHAMARDMAEMNRKMTGVPTMAAEMQRMNANIGVMTRGIDSTMGRMGRGMPFLPW